MSETCTYTDCQHPPFAEGKSSACIFHSDKEIQLQHIDVFRSELQKSIDNKDFHFKGFHFPEDINFTELLPKSTFTEDANFLDAVFSGFADFWKVKFEKDVNFSQSKFNGLKKIGFGKISCDFQGATFSGGAHFSEATFSAKAFFEKTTFSGEFMSFAEATFSGDAIFSGAKFLSNPLFVKVRFSGGAFFDEATFSEDAFFSEATFSKDAFFARVTFSRDSSFARATFSRDVFIWDTTFKNTLYLEGVVVNSTLHIENINFEKHSYLLIKAVTTNKKGTIFFNTVEFNPLRTSFENNRASYTSGEPSIVFLFRHCVLTNVLFTNNDLSGFSFFKSVFEKAYFVGNTWGSIVNRQNVIFEEQVYYQRENSELFKQLKEKLELKDLQSYKDISDLYRRMKVALDESKSYVEAGLFYYNEWETRRKYLKENKHKKLLPFLQRIFVVRKIYKKKNKPDLAQKFLKKAFAARRKYMKKNKSVLGRRVLYRSYKIFSGYGEKPLWSFGWFLGFMLIFAGSYMYSGLKTPDQTNPGKVDTLFNYDFAWQWPPIDAKSFSDFGNALIFSFQHVVPRNYLVAKNREYLPVEDWGEAVSLMNSFVLILFLVFIGIGLKRHFKRF